MRGDDIFNAMGGIDESFIIEADSYRGKRRGIRGAAIAASIALILSLSLYMLLPIGGIPKSLKRYSGSEYFDVITALESTNENTVVYPNRLLMLGDLLFSNTSSGVNVRFPRPMGGDDSILEGDLSAPGKNDISNGYVEVTDNQENGAIEGDIFKRTKTHIFYINIERDGERFIPVLRIYTVNGEESECVSEYNLRLPYDCKYFYSTSHNMYLTEDGKTLIYIFNYSDGGAGRTQIQYYDVSVPEETKLSRKISISGYYVTSRLIDGRITLVTKLNVRNPDYDKPETFIPSVDMGEGDKFLSPDSIVVPEVVCGNTYIVISTINEKGEFTDAQALLSYSDIIYSTDNALYAVHNYTRVEEEGFVFLGKYMSDITRIEYTEEGLKRGLTYTVEGDVLNQYSLDEEDGVLRVVTTVERMAMKHSNYGFIDAEYEGYNKGSSVSLFCIDVKSGKTLASVECFAPLGEEVTSVRFEGDKLYVCTAEVITFTDPVFFFDLSDINNITSTDTGYIEGFSTSLIDYGDGMLLGAGRLDLSSFKLELYTEGEEGVVSLDSYIYKGNVTEDYKGYLIDRELCVFGFFGSVFGNLNNYYEYKLIGIEDGMLKERMVITLAAADAGNTRAVIIDGYLYVLSANQFVVKPFN